MTPSDAIEKMIKLAISRHVQGIPDHILCFSSDGGEIEWAAVLAATPKEKVGNLNVSEPKPGTGYFCDIVLNGFSTDVDGERITFTVRSPTFNHKATYVQPHAGAGYFVQAVPAPDKQTEAALMAIGEVL